MEPNSLHPGGKRGGTAGRALRRLRRLLCGPRPLIHDPFEAMERAQRGSVAAFACPVAACRLLNGFSFGIGGWNPFTATALDAMIYRQERYAGSLLEQFYRVWQPQNAAAAVAGIDRVAEALADLPPHLFYLSPWRTDTAAAVRGEVEAWYHRDMVQLGHSGFTIPRHGFKHHGPVDPALGEVEFARVARMTATFSEGDYDRRHGEVRVLMLRRDDEVRFVNRGGLHRMAALDALGATHVPAVLQAPIVVDIADLHDWSQVARGVWTRAEAERYFNHLFDFDAAIWARQHGLQGNSGGAGARTPDAASEMRQIRPG